MNSFQKGVKFFAIFLAFLIILGIFSSISFGFSVLGSVFDDNHTVKTDYYKEVFTGVGSIKLESNFSDVNVFLGDEFSVEAIDLTGNILVKQDGERLKIEEDSVFLFFNKSGTINVTVPKVMLDDLSLSTGAGEVNLEGISASSLELDHGAGVLKINNSTFYNTDIDGGAGKIIVENSSLNNLDLDAGVGEIDIKASLTGKSKVECGVGSVQILIQNSLEDYQIYLEKGIGSILFNNESVSSDYRYGSGIHSLHVEGGVGSIKLNFES